MISIKTPDELLKIRAAGKILAQVASVVLAEAGEGVLLKSLDKLAEELIRKAGAQPAFLGYQPTGATKPYPCTICTSLNAVVVHGVPTAHKLKSGDLLKLDFGVRYKGYYADAAWTVGIGKVSPEAQRLVKVTEKALYKGIQTARSGNTLGDIGYAIQTYVQSSGFSVIEGLTGHGIGHKLHEDPYIPNEGEQGNGPQLKPGMVFALEPMVSAGSAQIHSLNDDSYATIDGSLSAHFEHTIIITEQGPEIVTKL